MPKYLPVEQAKEWIRQEKEITFRIEYTDELLEQYIGRIEKLLDSWIGQSLNPALYEEIKQTTRNGHFLTFYYPIISVVQVEKCKNTPIDSFSPVVVIKSSNPFYEKIQTFPISSYRCERNVIFTDHILSYLKVLYWAGYHPLPPEVPEVVYMALITVLKYGSFTVLFEPYRYVSSQSLPGGLSQSFSVAKPTPSLKNSFSFLDFLFYPLQKYKRHVIFI